MRHELVVFPNGTASVRPVGSSEAMHSTIGAWEEARALYVAQSGLASKLVTQHPEPLVLFDVGMGIAANALAAIDCWESLSAGKRRPLHVVSFENEIEGLRVALANSEKFPFYANRIVLLDSLLSLGVWKSEGLTWELRPGDFLKMNLSVEPAPEVIFYDFYSPKTAAPELWGYRSFSRLWRACATRRATGLGVTLTTYSSATSVRAAMLLAGFHVGIGAATEIKRETTVACTLLADLVQPLDQRWLEKFERSAKPLPTDWLGERGEQAREHVRKAEQFK